MEIPKRRFRCPEHGEAEARTLCIHLKKGSYLGFHVFPEPGSGTAPPGVPEALCNRCKFWSRTPAALAALYQFVAGGRITVCEHCFELARIGNERPRRKP